MLRFPFVLDVEFELINMRSENFSMICTDCTLTMINQQTRSFKNGE